MLNLRLRGRREKEAGPNDAYESSIFWKESTGLTKQKMTLDLNIHKSGLAIKLYDYGIKQV